MDIFCEFINNQLKIIIEDRSLELSVPSSFHKQIIDNPERLSFLHKCQEFVQSTNKKRPLINRIITYPLANKVYIRTDLITKLDILNLLDFSEGILIARKTKIFDSQSLSANNLVSCKFDESIDLIKQINEDYRNKNRVSKVEIKSRRFIQNIGLGTTLIISILLAIFKDLTNEQEPQLHYPSIYWFTFFSLLLFNSWVEYSKMKIVPKAIFLGFFGVIIAIMLIARGLTTKAIVLLELNNGILWTEFILQAIFYYLWNEKVAVYFATRNGQVNK
tara:strand:+ start:59 stop:883 length:825 start_codon:yes stop_codon:yes gene_type:complete